MEVDAPDVAGRGLERHVAQQTLLDIPRQQGPLSNAIYFLTSSGTSVVIQPQVLSELSRESCRGGGTLQRPGKVIEAYTRHCARGGHRKAQQSIGPVHGLCGQASEAFKTEDCDRTAACHVRRRANRRFPSESTMERQVT